MITLLRIRGRHHQLCWNKRPEPSVIRELKLHGDCKSVPNWNLPGLSWETQDVRSLHSEATFSDLESVYQMRKWMKVNPRAFYLLGKGAGRGEEAVSEGASNRLWRSGHIYGKGH